MKNGDPNWLLIFFGKETPSEQTIMDIVQIFDEKSYNNNGKPWKSSKILCAKTETLEICGNFAFFGLSFLNKIFFFFIFSFFFYFVLFLCLKFDFCLSVDRGKGGQEWPIWKWLHLFIFHVLLFLEKKDSCFFFLLHLPLLAFMFGFNKRCFLHSRYSMEMWCLDDKGRDSWDWVTYLGESMIQLTRVVWRLFACLKRSLPRLNNCCCCRCRCRCRRRRRCCCCCCFGYCSWICPWRICFSLISLVQCVFMFLRPTETVEKRWPPKIGCWFSSGKRHTLKNHWNRRRFWRKKLQQQR